MSKQLLFLGCFDLRNPLTAIISSPADWKLDIHITDANLPTFARNVAMLKIITSKTFDPSKENDFQYLWDVWCNATWSESTEKRFLQDISSLERQKFQEGPVILDASSQKKVKELWSGWMIWLQMKIPSSVDNYLSRR